MKINGTLINYYFHCQRQCWLHAHRLNMEDNSEDVHIGKAIHKVRKNKFKNTEIKIDNISIDRITDKYLIETKKSDADIESTKWQTLYYLKILKEKGIYRIGKIEFIEKNKQNKNIIYLQLTDGLCEKLKILSLKIENFLLNEFPPKKINSPKCKKCSYYQYCFI